MRRNFLVPDNNIFFKIKYVEVEKFILAEHCTISSRLNASCPNSFATCKGPQALSLQMLIPRRPQGRKLIVLRIRSVQPGLGWLSPHTPQNPPWGPKPSCSQLLAMLPADSSQLSPSCTRPLAEGHCYLQLWPPSHEAAQSDLLI